MPLDAWLRYPAGCDTSINVVTLPTSRIGLQCVTCGRKI